MSSVALSPYLPNTRLSLPSEPYRWATSWPPLPRLTVTWPSKSEPSALSVVVSLSPEPLTVMVASGATGTEREKFPLM